MNEKSIVVLDLETTSNVVSLARIVSYSMFDPESGEHHAGFVNPEMPIPPASTEVHGITDDMVKDAPKFSELADRIHAFLADRIVCGYNALQYDVEVLKLEFRRVSLVYDCPGVLDPFIVWNRLERRTLENAYARFCGKILGDDAHDADADARAAYDVYTAMKAQWSLTPEEFLRYSMDPPEGFLDRDRKIKLDGDEPALNFGKYLGMQLRYCPKDYLQWCLTTDMSSHVKDIIRRYL